MVSFFLLKKMNNNQKCLKKIMSNYGFEVDFLHFQNALIIV